MLARLLAREGVWLWCPCVLLGTYVRVLARRCLTAACSLEQMAPSL